MATRSASRIASSTSWVTSTTVRGSRASVRESQPCISPRVIASSAPNGSSRQSTGFPESSVRRNATRWRIPPESSAGWACWKPSSPSSLNSAAARRRACPRGQPGDAKRERGVVDRAQPGEQQVVLGHQRRRRAGDRAAVGALQPADQLEQGGLAAAARPHHGKQLAVGGAHGHAGERLHRRRAAVVV